MEIRKNLELVNVECDGSTKATMMFLDKERKEVRTVTFNKQVYDNGKFIDNDEKAQKVEQWCQDYFGCAFSELSDQIGAKKDIYVYDNFNSLWECEIVNKFDESQVGQIYQTEVKEIIIDNIAIRIRYDIDGKTYESKMTFATYLDTTKEWYVDPNKKAKKLEQFEDKFGVDIDHKDELIGHPLMVEVKSAFGKNYYGDIKKFPKKK